MGRLSARRRKFIQEYLVDLNAKHAAIRAGYSPASAETNGPRLLRDAQVKAEVARRQGKLAEKVEITQEWLAEKLAEWACEGGRDRVAAAQTLARLLGLNAPERSEVNVSGPPNEIIARAKKAIAAIEAKRDVEEDA